MQCRGTYCSTGHQIREVSCVGKDIPEGAQNTYHCLQQERPQVTRMCSMPCTACKLSAFLRYYTLRQPGYYIHIIFYVCVHNIIQVYIRIQMCFFHGIYFTPCTSCSSTEWDLRRQAACTLLPVCSRTELLQHSWELCRKLLWNLQKKTTATVVANFHTVVVHNHLF